MRRSERWKERERGKPPPPSRQETPQADTDAAAEAAPIRLAVVAELEGLVLGPPGDVFNERWAEVEHLEWALRLVLARRLGRLAGWSEWIHICHPLEPDEWPGQVRAAWREVSRLGRA
jgi:hypothetical protein